MADSSVQPAMETAMTGSTTRFPKSFRASETEQASIRALKNWLLAAPPENALEDQIVRQRLSTAIATLSEAQDHHPERKAAEPHADKKTPT